MAVWSVFVFAHFVFVFAASPNPRLLVGILSIPWTSGLDSSAARRNIRLLQSPSTGTLVQPGLYTVQCTVYIVQSMY